MWIMRTRGAFPLALGVEAFCLFPLSHRKNYDIVNPLFYILFHVEGTLLSQYESEITRHRTFAIICP